MISLVLAMFAHTGQRWREQFWTHRFPLLGVTIAIAIGQIINFKDGIPVATTPDTDGYIGASDNITTYLHFVDPFRSPGYPSLLAVVFRLAGQHNFPAVIVAQAIITIGTLYAIYALIFLLIHQRWMAVIVVALLSLNIGVLAWERELMTETLSWSVLVAIFLVMQRYLATRRLIYMVAFGFLCVVAVLTRPIFVFFPWLFLAVLLGRDLWQHQLRTTWKPIALASIITVCGILGYMGVNRWHNHYFGISYVSNVNLLAQVIRFHMFDLPANPHYIPLQQELIAYYNGGGRDPWIFVQHSPYTGYFYNEVASFSTNEITHHPLVYIAHLPAAFRDAWLAPPSIPSSANFPANPILIGLSWLAFAPYFLLPLLMIAVIFLFWKKRGDTTNVVLLVMLLTVVGQILIIATGSYGDFNRLRWPVDWLVAVMVVIVGYQLAVFWRTQRSITSDLADVEVDLDATLPRTMAVNAHSSLRPPQ